MKIAIRMDDITPDMDWANFMRFKELCDKYQIKPLLGIVPDNKDENLRIYDPKDAPVKDFWLYMQELGRAGWPIAQHGVYHIYTTSKMGCFPLNRLSEFAGISYNQQYELLRAGRNSLRLHGISTDIFMAPAHSFDRNTLKALKKLGFHSITDGFGALPYSRHGITFYPIAFRQEGALKRKQGYTTFVVHTNTMKEKDFRRYENLFAQYKDRLISYTELLNITPQKRGLAGSLGEYIVALMKFMLVSLHQKL